MPELRRAHRASPVAGPAIGLGRRRGRGRGVLAAAATVLALLLTGCTTGTDDGDPAVAEAGYQAGDGSYSAWAPQERGSAVDLVAQTFDGETLDLASWRGDVVVLNFWYAECPPCRVEAPDLAEISRDYADSGVHLLGVNSTNDAATVAAFNETFGITYPSLDDSDARAVAALEGVVALRAMPTTVVLDREGRPAYRIMGIADGPTLRGLIDDVLAEA